MMSAKSTDAATMPVRRTSERITEGCKQSAAGAMSAFHPKQTLGIGVRWTSA
jgi:hypothetical protein